MKVQLISKLYFLFQEKMAKKKGLMKKCLIEEKTSNSSFEIPLKILFLPKFLNHD